jgi:hypothetical protein
MEAVRRGPTTRAVQIALGMAVLGAALILCGLFGVVISVIGLLLIVAGTVLSAPAAPSPGQPGRGWWPMLAAGAALSLLGALVSIASDTIGGLIAVAGGVAVVVGAALGFPLEDREN